MDKITYEILEDGTVKFSTDEISEANHASADELMKQFDQVLGGAVNIEHKAKHKAHHAHRHAHGSAGEHHQHH